jgi:hypothetical protein
MTNEKLLFDLHHCDVSQAGRVARWGRMVELNYRLESGGGDCLK